MLISIIGDIRQGKTFLGTLFALLSYTVVYSNFKINIPNYKPLNTPEELLNLPNDVLVIIDEAYSWIESRKSTSDINVFASTVLFQSGKRTIDIIVISQLFSAIDIRFRNMSNLLIECFYNNIDGYFQFDGYVRQNTEFIYTNTLILDYNDAKDYFEYFDTYEIVESESKEKYEINSILRSSEKFLETIENLSFKVKKELKKSKTTHPNIKIGLLKIFNKENKQHPKLWINAFETYVHAYLNNTE